MNKYLLKTIPLHICTYAYTWSLKMGQKYVCKQSDIAGTSTYGQKINVKFAVIDV